MHKKIIFLSILGIILDRILKTLVIKSLPLYGSIKIIPSFFYITYVTNTGAAWSILDGNRFLFIFAALIAIMFLINYVRKEKNINKIDILMYSMLFSGILGNMIDRILYGYVIDFISINIINYNFPIFNVADIFIVLSAMIMIYKLIRGETNENSVK